MIRRKIYLSIFLMTLTFLLALNFIHFDVKIKNVISEEQYSLGLIPTTDISKYEPFDFKKISPLSLPTTFDLSSKMPPVGNQGSQGSCASWATTYYYKTYQEGKERGWNLNTTDHQFSPAYVYNQIVNGYCNRGSTFPENFEILKNQGADPLSIFPYNQYDCSTQPNASQIAAAYPYRILNYEFLFYGQGTANIDNLKSYLYTQNDVFVIAIPVYENFFYIPNDPNYVYTTPSGNYVGGHALTVVGFNDNLQAFKVINSWGTGWGYGGYVNISYSFIRNYAWEGWVMTDYIEPNQPKVWVIQPNGGEVVTAGTTYEIRWSYEGISSGYVKIELYKGGVLNRTIASTVLITSGKYNWSIPTTQVSGSDYKIRITYTSNTSVFDESDNFFTINGPPPPKVWVIQPNGGEVVTAGTTYEIRWSYEGISSGYVKIELYKGGVLNRTIASTVLITSGKYNWSIPTTQVSGSDYKIRITYTSNTSVFDESDNFFTIEPPKANWTIFVYLDGDNDLESAAIDDVNEMEQATLPNSINVIVQIDRAPGYDTSNGNWTTTRRYKIVHDTNTSIISSQLIQDMGELDMGNPQTLIDFVTWGYQNYPAYNYLLILWDHGSGWKNMNLSQTYKGVCYDYTNNSYIDTIELRTALTSINSTTGKKLDIVAFDACLMGMIEIGYEIKQYVNIMVASEETIPGDGFPYNDILISLSSNPTMSKESLSSLIVNKYVQSYSGGSQGYADVTLSSINLNNISILTTEVSEFANLLINNFSTYKNQIYTAWLNCLYFDDPDYIDLYDFVRLIKQYINDSQIQSKAQEVIDSFSQVIIAESHTPYYSNAHGLSIYYPYPTNYLDTYEDLLFAIDTYWNELIKLPF